MTYLYVADTSPLADDGRLRAYAADLSDFRREKIRRLARGEDRRLSLGTGVLLDVALRENFGLREHDLVTETTEYGKPFFAYHNEIRFSVSHSGECALVALSDGEVGCDVERIRPIPPGLAQRFFTPEEAAECAEDPDRFFTIWTRKEACVKAAGQGFSISPASFSVLGREDETVRAVLPDGRTLFCQTVPALPGYRAALCTFLPVDFRVTVVDLTQKTGDMT